MILCALLWNCLKVFILYSGDLCYLSNKKAPLMRRCGSYGVWFLCFNLPFFGLRSIITKECEVTLLHPRCKAVITELVYLRNVELYLLGALGLHLTGAELAGMNLTWAIHLNDTTNCSGGLAGVCESAVAHAVSVHDAFFFDDRPVLIGYLLGVVGEHGEG